VEKYAETVEKEGNIETLLKAKGFEKSLVIISDKGINVVVKSEGLTSQQTLQIQDVVTNETDITLQNIKIIPVAK
ncbi:MAG: SpoIIIAH-like family protein, partial [Clostridia bacterium]|nr:SpoIIIAH-like family protein [Clostridia bacterium]